MTAAAGGKNADAVARDLGTVAAGRLSAVMADDATAGASTGSCRPTSAFERTAISRQAASASQKMLCTISCWRSRFRRRDDRAAAHR